MTPSRLRPGRLCALLVVASLAAAPVAAQSDLRETFDRGVELLRQGDREAALRELQKVLAMDPSHEAAYELWKETEHRVWLDILSERGQFQLVGERLMDLARLGRAERVDDADAIRSLREELFSDDLVARKRAIVTLGARHGEFAVPYLLGALADPGDDDRRVDAIHALTEMGPVVVLPLVEAMRSDDPFLRRQVAYTLGYVGDRRAQPVLAWHASADPDPTVVEAARESLRRMGAGRDALAGYLRLGGAYRTGDPSVVGPGLRSSVVWHWDGRLVKRPVPDYLWADEMASKAFSDALSVEPGSADALAGLAASRASQMGVLAARSRGGADVAELRAGAREGLLAVAAAGPAALDGAIALALDAGDEAGALVLCRVLGRSAVEPTPALERALDVRGPVRTEAALALARVAVRSGASPGSGVVDALASAASREVQKIAAVVDADARRSTVVQNELEQRGVIVRSWESGAVALASMQRSPGFDVIVVGESLPDLTVHQVLGQLGSDALTSGTPRLVAAEDAEAADELYGDYVSGFVTTNDLSALDAALDFEVTGERAAARELARRAARSLETLSAGALADVAAVQDILLRAAAREDAVAVPVMEVLGRSADAAAVETLASVATDAERSTEARVAAADALAGVFGRHPGSGSSVADALAAVATGDADLDVRLAVAGALGQLDLEPSYRAGLLNDVRARVGR